MDNVLTPEKEGYLPEADEYYVANAASKPPISGGAAGAPTGAPAAPASAAGAAPTNSGGTAAPSGTAAASNSKGTETKAA